MIFSHRSIASLLLYGCVTSWAAAAPVTISFDSLSDSEAVSTQFSGLTFDNTLALQAGISLNEFEFPPRSGDVVVSDLGGPISILFEHAISQFIGYFTHVTDLELKAFGAGGVLAGSAASRFSNNLALSGDAGSSPNELLGVSSIAGIRSVVISADPSGGSFTLDDLTYSLLQDGPPPPPPGPVPVSEPGVLMSVLLGLAGLVSTRRRTGQQPANT